MLRKRVDGCKGGERVENDGQRCGKIVGVFAAAGKEAAGITAAKRGCAKRSPPAEQRCSPLGLLRPTRCELCKLCKLCK